MRSDLDGLGQYLGLDRAALPALANTFPALALNVCPRRYGIHGTEVDRFRSRPLAPSVLGLRAIGHGLHDAPGFIANWRDSAQLSHAW